MWYFIDVAMEVDLVQRVKSEQKPSGLDLEIISVFNGVDDCLFVEAEVIEDLMCKVALVVPLIADLLEKFFVVSESISLSSTCFIDFKLQGRVCLLEWLNLMTKLLHFLSIFSFFFVFFFF